MNTELLRGDERIGAHESFGNLIALLGQRLIEEREKKAELNAELNSLSDALDKLEAKLAEARKIIRDGINIPCSYDACCGVKFYSAVIDAAMKEGR